MEQYQLFQKNYFSSLKHALSHADPVWFFVRFMGSRGGKIVIDEDIKNRKLKIKKQNTTLIFLLDNTIFYEYKKSDGNESWSIQYQRLIEGHLFLPRTGLPNPWDGDYTGPNDPRLPEPHETKLRSCNGEHLIEIGFNKKIPIVQSKTLTKDTAFLHEWIITPKEKNHDKGNIIL
jgi:hypothetical protein